MDETNYQDCKPKFVLIRAIRGKDFACYLSVRYLFKIASFNVTPSPGACGIVATPSLSVVATVTISVRSGDSDTVYSQNGISGVMAAICSVAATRMPDFQA